MTHLGGSGTKEKKMNYTIDNNGQAVITFDKNASNTVSIHNIASSSFDRVVKVPKGQTAVILASYYGGDMVSDDIGALYNYMGDCSCIVLHNNGNKIHEVEIKKWGDNGDFEYEFLKSGRPFNVNQ